MSSHTWIDCCQEQDDERFSERSTERRQVFEDAAARLDTMIPPSVWAFLQVTDLEIVKKMTQSDVSWLLMDSDSSVWSSRAKDALRLWIIIQHLNVHTPWLSLTMTHPNPDHNAPRFRPPRQEPGPENHRVSQRPALGVTLGSPNAARRGTGTFVFSRGWVRPRHAIFTHGVLSGRKARVV